MPFDEKKAERALKFIKMLKLTGDYHGQPFLMMDWFEQVVWDVYGTMNERGLRLFRDVYVEIPKKNAKSQAGSAISLLHLFHKNERNGQIYSVAGDRAQASIIFDMAVEMILQENELEKRVRIQSAMKAIINKETGTLYRVLSAESDTKHGYSPTVVLFDELHVQPNRKLYEIMMRGSGLARLQPLRYVFTTAGEDPDRTSIAWEVHEKAVNIIKAREDGDAERDDPTWYPVIYGYQGDDIYNEENWKKANPGLGVTIQVEDMRVLAKQAKLHPADEKSFRWLNLNQWLTTRLTGWLPVELFDTTIGGDWTRADLIDSKTKLDCYIGMDLSATTDLSALAVIFPPQSGLEKWRVLWDAFIPLENMEERVARDRVPYDKWLAQGFIHATPGNVIDYGYIERKILEYAQVFNIVEIGADMSLATGLLQRLEEQGVKGVPVPQNYATLTEPMSLMEVLLKKGEMEHEDHPVARWCFGNASIHTNGNGQYKYVKESRGGTTIRTKRIDIVAAWVHGMARAKFYDSAASVYDGRGLLML